METRFLERARTPGLEVLTGYEPFFYQGIDAVEIFAWTVPDPRALCDRLTRS